jgi:signal transduction histidine kinase
LSGNLTVEKRFRFIVRSPGIAAALALSLLISASAFAIWQEYIVTSDQTRRTTVMILNVKELLADVLDAESSARGYLLSGNARVLAHFRAASASADERSRVLFDSRNNFYGQDRLFRELSKNSGEKLRILRARVAAAQRSFALAPVSDDSISSDEDLITSIRSLSVQAQAHLQDAFWVSRNRSRFLARLSEWIATLGCIGIFGIVLVSQIRIQRLAASRVRLNEELTGVNEDLRQFVYSASHDLQEPLRVLMLYSDLVERNLKAKQPVQEELDHLRRAAKQMSALLLDLLAYTQVVSGPMNTAASSDLRIEVDKAIESLRVSVDETHAEISIGELPVVRMESAHALLLLQNLISNSLKYRKRSVSPRIGISSERIRDKWVISVADNGIGVPPAYHQQIFGIFKRLHTRTAYPGTGLGLAICRKIVERYGGAIWVESQPDNGSTFRFSVPDEGRS